VKGGAGFIGSHLVDRLMSKSFDVIVLDDFSSGSMKNLDSPVGKSNFRLVNGDVRNKNVVKKALKNVDVVDRLKRGEEPIIHGDGEQTRNFVFVGDVVDTYLRAMKSKNFAGDVINVGAGVEVSINRLANVLTELPNLHGVKFVYAEPMAVDIRRSCPDLSKAERLLGYKPEVSLRKGLAMLFRELRVRRP